MTVTISAGGFMASLSSLVEQLKRERDRVEKEFARLNAALRAFAGAAQRARWPSSGQNKRTNKKV
jgi:hypothetical protein